MRFQTMHSCTMTITALAGNGLSTTIPAFIKAVCAKAEVQHELQAAPLPEGADVAQPQWTLVLRADDMQYLAGVAMDLRAALKLMHVDLCTEED